MGLKDMGAMVIWKFLVININLLTWIIYKNGQSIINTSSNIITPVLYFCETIFKDYYSISKNIFITTKPLIQNLN